MKLIDLFKSKSSFFNKDLKSKKEVIDFLADNLLNQKIIKSKAEFTKAILAREKQDSTGIGDGIAIPHALNKTVLDATVAFVSLKKPIEWGSLDNKPVDLIFMIATNGTDGEEHLVALSQLSTHLMKSEKQAQLRKTKTFTEFKAIFAEEKKTEVKLVATNKHFDVIGITACPTGIAHTYMAQEKLLESAHELGLTAKIETQGRRGTEDRLTKEDIDNAKVIILAHDKAIAGLDRFNGKEVIDTTSKDAIYNGKKLIENFKDNPKKVVIKAAKSKDDDNSDFSLKKFKDIKGNLLGGVSRMLPFVVAGGIILGLGFLIDSLTGTTGGNLGVTNEFAGILSGLGKTAMFMMVPILGGYIAYSIVGPQGLMPGIIAGMIADGSGGFLWGKFSNDNMWAALWSRILPNNIPTTSGFIGAMVGAYVAAFIVFGLTKGMSKMPKSFAGVRDIVFIPLLSLIGVGVSMLALSIPLGYAMFGMQEGLKWLAYQNLIVLVAGILGLMMCVDMGGPINKIAYVIGTLTVGAAANKGIYIEFIQNGTTYNYASIFMGASMAAGMIPPLGIALCTVVFKKTWAAKERDAAKANWLMGAFFITEGAIPFMVSDPKRISVSALVGGTITGLLVGALEIGLGSPHGGVVVFPLLRSFLFEGQLGVAMGIVFYILAIIVGVAIMALILGFWKTADIKKGKLLVESEIVKKEKVRVAKKAIRA
ncbi:PTS system, fructose-specific IIABC component [Williamsoniiplasma somnilux]|uniref:PTS system, fructose-specific IIABC component n=1 Tax=Williamsoniiplasma somnilux TaxID=215578 RepID=A0A2K8NXM2_9MOLU|nr:fructose-specific PTS transporter subunit EIIC [Williamsoniiplasma somnilux]ATZ18537.1 PTS system, fructose-specific IIABC component [Williamsoniiplasma somnilux]